MFKRVEKRRRKQEEEEDLGLDEDMKEVLGINDTDSEESDSDSDDSESEAEEDAGEGEAGGDNGEGEGEDSSDEGDDDAEEPPISVAEALRDPVYIVSLQPDVKACIVCPGKVFKSADILTLHRASKAHERRWRQFSAFAKTADAAPDTNAWDVLKLKAEEQPKLSLTPSTVSKRTEKREKQKAKMEARREKKREAKMKAKAKAKAAAPADGASSSPAPKKRKVEVAAPADAPESAKPPKALKARSPRTDRLERQGKLHAQLAAHEPPGGRGKGNGKKKGPGGRGKQGTEVRGRTTKGSGRGRTPTTPSRLRYSTSQFELIPLSDK
ncbi:hypothetical protein B0H17DRAFT_1325299 [Mycena rosella]|uniref:Uncharacterized protein n=1 Tax=Mycena rosella TaxID=1033263 RepID=A0AAD7MA67_MYCRO|nr:hypothetical protein B0H17DRAFT_1325299 [Mycena rosella]